MDPLIGQTIDNYRIDEVIGRGGMGVVYKAADLNLDKTVALKMIDPFLARDENFLKRFKTEAKALAKLENPNIVSVYALRETPMGVFMVMEYVEAKTISEWIRERGKLSVSETLTVTVQILNAIGHAHTVGVIHRDIKPNNVLLCENGTVKVMDFGLAKVVQDISQNTVTQTAAGTLYYMSPEQIKGLKNVDNRSDIYSIGMSVYEMVTGQTPFDKSKSEYEIQKQIIDGDIPSPLQFNPAIPKSLVKLIKKSIDKDPAKRYQNIDEMKSAFYEIDIPDKPQEKTFIMEKQNTNAALLKKKISLSKLILFTGTLVLVILLLLIFYFSNSNERVTESAGAKQINDINIRDTAGIKILMADLSINSAPAGADVYVNGNISGVTPFNIKLDTGYYSVSLKKNGYKTSNNRSLHIKEGINNFSFVLEPETELTKTESIEAELKIYSVPPADIFIDNKLFASADGELMKHLKAGSYNIKFVHSKYGSKTTAIKLKDGQKKSITCYFEQNVNIQSLNSHGDAFWGTVYINGTNTNLTTPVDIPLGPGKYLISVSKAGYKTIEDNFTILIEPEFEKKTHPLVFHFK
jgi:serine/threonine protein kinase